MYDVDIIEANKEFIESVIEADRERFRIPYTTIIKYLDGKQLALGGKAAVYALIGELDLDSLIREGYSLEVFGSNANQHAKEIAQQIFRDTAVENCYMRPTEEGVFEVHWNQRKMITFHTTDKYEGLDLIEVMRPQKIKIAAANIFTLSPEILLIGVYRQLIQPECYDQREELQKQEEKLFSHFSKGFTGSADLDYGSEEVVELKKAILDKVFGEAKNTILVGKQAIDRDSNLIMLHVASGVDFEQIEDLAIKCTKRELQFRKFNLTIPIDFRLRRFRINLVAGRNLQIIDVFNAPSYDLILNHPYTHMRFLFADIWSVQLLNRAKRISDENTASQINKFVSWIKKARSQVSKYQDKYNDPEQYIGQHMRDGAARAILNKKNKFLVSFYPAAVTTGV